jgi:hypothetical protein
MVPRTPLPTRRPPHRAGAEAERDHCPGGADCDASCHAATVARDEPARQKARAQLAGLAVTNRVNLSSTYDRDAFGSSWVDTTAPWLGLVPKGTTQQNLSLDEGRMLGVQWFGVLESEPGPIPEPNGSQVRLVVGPPADTIGGR